MTSTSRRTQGDLLAELDSLIAEWKAAAEPTQSNRISLSAPVFDEREVCAALRTILDNWITQGPKVREFEAAFAGYAGVRDGVAVNSGSSANLIALTALMALGELRPGDEVIVPATTFPTVASPVLQLGCVPVYVDVDLETLNIDPALVEAAISARTRAIIAVHTLGYPAESTMLADIAKRRGCVLMEDCCEAHGTAIDGRRAGSFGEVATFSFFVAHNMTTGEGGMVLANDERLLEAARSLREFGRVDQTNVVVERWANDPVLGEYDRRYLFDRLGYNVRMTDITASFGLEQLVKLEAMNSHRIAHAARYRSRLRRYEQWLRLPPQRPGRIHAYYTYAVALKPGAPIERNDLARWLDERGIETRPIFAGCLPDQPAFRGTPQRVFGDLTNAREIRDRALFFGVHPGLREADVDRVADAFDELFASL
jgi:CDP-4-dehydro-6-deoxyglucose reductase, E1